MTKPFFNFATNQMWYLAYSLHELLVNPVMQIIIIWPSDPMFYIVCVIHYMP